MNAAVYEAGEARPVWVNSADDPANCSFTMMSVIRRVDLVVAIGTGGRSPALAAHLRRLAERGELGPEYEILLDLLSEAREAMRASGPSARKMPIGNRPSTPASWTSSATGRVDDAKELLSSCL